MKKKPLLVLAIALLSFLLPDSVSGMSVAVDGICYSTFITGSEENAVADSAWVAGLGDSSSGAANIPSSITFPYSYRVFSGYDDKGRPIYVTITRYLSCPVTAIANRAFYECEELTSLSISGSITYIGDNAFYGCSGLTGSLTIPSSVTNIGAAAFCGCKGLASVNIPSSVTTINSSVFSGCIGLTGFSIPESVTSIGAYAFCGCSNLSSVTIPDNVTEIGYGAFEYSGIKSLTIGRSVTVIKDYAFCYCENLKTVIWNAISCDNSGDNFYHATVPYSSDPNFYKEYAISNIENVIIGNGVEKFPLFLTGNMKELTIPSSVKTVTFVGANGGYYETGSIETINWNAVNCRLSACLSCENLYIDAGVESISHGHSSSVFCGFVVNRIVTCYSLMPPEIDEDLFDGQTYRDAVLSVSKGSLEAYKEAEGWRNFFTISDNVMELSKAFHKGFKTTFSNKEPMGVTSDGVSRMYIYFDREIESVSSYSVTSRTDYFYSDSTMNGNYGELILLPNGRFGFDYCAPNSDYYDTNGYDINLTVKLVLENGDTIVGITKFKVLRPGVLLVHGLWSDEGCFNDFKEALIDGNIQSPYSFMKYNKYENYQVYNCSYQGSHAESFENNTRIHKVIQSSLEQLYDQLAKEGIISSKYDLVGHSMGGILSRIYAQEVNADAVNRIITLDTPHSGSHLADLAHGIVSIVSYLTVNSDEGLKNSMLCLKDKLTTTGRFAALENLSTHSEAIRRLNDPNQLAKAANIPVHAISSCTTNGQTIPAQMTIHKAVSFSTVGLPCLSDVLIGNTQTLLSMSNSYEWLKAFYHGENDCVVSHDSQSGGLNGDCLTVNNDIFCGFMGSDSHAHHCNTNKWHKTYQTIAELLFSPISGLFFSQDGYHPLDLSSSNYNSQYERTPLREAHESSFVNLSIEPVDTIRALTVRVDPSEDIRTYVAYAFVGDDKIIISNDQEESIFIIPDNFEGTLKVFALGRTIDGEIVADVDSIVYRSITSLMSLQFENTENLTMNVGQMLTFPVIASWDNGETEYVTPAFSVSETGILKIDCGLVEALKADVCELIAEYQGKTCTKLIRVTSDEDLMGDVNNDHEVNIADINAVIDAILSGGFSSVYDVNDDGEVNIADINAIIDIILNQ